MLMHETNPGAQKAALLIHPMLAGANGIEVNITSRWGSDVRCLVPDLSAHGDDAASTFVSAAGEARGIHDWLVARGVTHLQLGYGASLGAATLLELLAYQDITFDQLFFEGPSFSGRVPLFCGALTWVFIHKHRQAVADPALCAQRMSGLYGEVAGPLMAQRFIAMSEESISNIVRSVLHADLPALSPDVQARCTFAYGEKDAYLKGCKRRLGKLYPGASLEVWPGYGHCGRITADSDAYAALLRELVG